MGEGGMGSFKDKMLAVIMIMRLICLETYYHQGKFT